jgi:hypothetical protein
MKWLPGISNNGEVLCFGTGRGLVLIYDQLKEAVRIYKEIEEGKYTHTQTEKFQAVIKYYCLAFQRARGIYGL